jgi:type IV pilus assembly protein PilV
MIAMPLRAEHLKSRKQNQGFSLIEVVVAMLIVSVGILGVAGLQVVSLQQNQSAMLRSEALQLGNDILDRMRANPLSNYATVEPSAVPPAATNCVTNVCVPAAMTLYDIAQWKCSINSTLDPAANTSHQICLNLAIAGSLPGGTGAIYKDGIVYRVVIDWLDDRAGGRRSITLRTQSQEP